MSLGHLVMDNIIKDQNTNSQNNMSDSNEAFIEYFVKKTEKISGAIYIITNFIPEGEPIRKRIQKNVLKLLSTAFSVKRAGTTENTNSSHVFTLTSQIIPEMTSLLSIAHASGYITEMNSSIIIGELKNISNGINERFSPGKALLVSSEDLFVSKNRAAANNTQKDILSSYHKGQNAISDTTHSGRQNKRSPKKDGKRTIAKRNERRETIMSLLEENEEISVKEVAVKLPHYSEKTLQRELIKMVDEGVLHKEGERRWSRYSLKK